MAITCHLLLLYQVPSSSHISIQYLLAHFRISDSPLLGSSIAFGRFLLVFCRGLIIVRLLQEWFDRINQNFCRLSIYELDQHFLIKSTSDETMHMNVTLAQLSVSQWFHCHLFLIMILWISPQWIFRSLNSCLCLLSIGFFSLLPSYSETGTWPHGLLQVHQLKKRKKRIRNIDFRIPSSEY